MRYRIEYSPDAEDHLRALTPRNRRIVLDEVDIRLTYEADVENRNRKPMRPNPLAPWELRIGNLKVYYDVVQQPTPSVMVRAIGVKRRNAVWIGGEEIAI